MREKHKISSVYIRLILAANPELAAPLNELFRESSSTALEQDYFDGDIADKLFEVLESYGIASIALNFYKQLHITSHGPLGFAALSAPDLRTALQTLVEHSSVRSTLIETTLVEDKTNIKIISRVLSEDPLVCRWLSEMSLAITHSVIETIMAHDVSAQTHIQFTHAPPKYTQALNELLGLQCDYKQDENAISIPASWGDVKSPLSDQSSYMDNLAKCRSIMLALNSQANTINFVQHQLNEYFALRLSHHIDKQSPTKPQIDAGAIQLPTQIPTLSELANRLAVSPRTLARRLERRGSSYKDLLQSQRKELATQWLNTTHFSVADIAYLLGYQEPANFTRAFKTWHNCSPQQWRKLSLIDRTITR